MLALSSCEFGIEPVYVAASTEVKAAPSPENDVALTLDNPPKLVTVPDKFITVPPIVICPVVGTQAVPSHMRTSSVVVAAERAIEFPVNCRGLVAANPFNTSELDELPEISPMNSTAVTLVRPSKLNTVSSGRIIVDPIVIGFGAYLLRKPSMLES